MRIKLRSLVLLATALTVFAPESARARAQPQAQSPSPSNAPAATPATPTTPAPAAAPAAPAAPAAAPSPAQAVPEQTAATPVRGRSRSDGKPSVLVTPRGAHRAARAKGVPADAPIATMPGFEVRSDGSSRVFVQVSKAVKVEERKGQGQLTYVLKGAHVLKRNNKNPLVTVHWNTPVSSARLVPTRGDVDFVLELRATATPTWNVVSAEDGTATLQIDFPKGSYVAGVAPPPAMPGENGAAPTGDGDADGDVGADAVAPRRAAARAPVGGSGGSSTRTRNAPQKRIRLTPPPPKSPPTP